jgi:hypothetical protein
VCGRRWIVASKINHIVVSTQVDVGSVIAPWRPADGSAVVEAIAFEAAWYVGHRGGRREMQMGGVGVRLQVRAQV